MKTIYLKIKQINPDNYDLLDLLKDSLILDEDCPSGLRWRERPMNHFKTAGSWRHNCKVRAGNPAGMFAKGSNHESPSYWVLTFFQRILKCHRVIWMLQNDCEIPDGMFVDHWNGDTKDNQICNLRLATSKQNSQNRKLGSSNSSGYKGVAYRPRASNGTTNKNPYIAQIRIEGVNTILGYFDDAAEAYEVYMEAAKKHHGEFARKK